MFRTLFASASICALLLTAPALGCTGDCANDGLVTVSDLVTGVNIALGALPVARCLAFDPSGDDAVRISELLEGVNALLGGCPVPTVTPTAAATATATPITTATPTPSATATPSATPSASPTATETAATTPTATASATATASFTVFTDVTAAAGVDYVQFEFETPPLGEAEYFSGGAAAGDYDRDGWIDLVATRLHAPPILFRNRGDGTFSDVTTGSGIDVIAFGSNGAAWGDIDNDGDADLYITTLGEFASRFYLFINDGSGHFTEAAVERGAAVAGDDSHFGMSVTFGDYDRDGWLDLHTTEWRFALDNSTGAPSNARLLRNRGAAAPGHFTDVTIAAGVSMDGVPTLDPQAVGTFPFASRFADLDDDGWPDLAIASDFGTSRLFWNNRDGTFSDGTVAAGVGSDENGMGSAIGDVDGDGRLDWFVTAIFDPDYFCDLPEIDCFWGTTGNRLYRNLGDRRFADVTDAAGVRDGYWGWGAAIFDYDNDADLDIAMTNGVRFAAFMIPQYRFVVERFLDDPMRLWRNDGTTAMSEVSAVSGLTDTNSGKGLLTFDYDRDGDLDLFVANNAGHPVLYRNDGGNRSGWLRVAVQGRDANRDGIGARVFVQAATDGPVQRREIDAGSHYLGQSELAAHVGLGAGDAPVHKVWVEWPATGRMQTFTEVPRNTTLVVVEPAAEPAGAAAARGR